MDAASIKYELIKFMINPWDLIIVIEEAQNIASGRLKYQGRNELQIRIKV
jgi:hypothetical protein